MWKSVDNVDRKEKYYVILKSKKIVNKGRFS